MVRMLSQNLSVVLAISLLSVAISFHTTPTFHASSRGKTALQISSWGKDGPPQATTLSRENPEQKVQAYLKEPEAVEARSNIDGTCLVSGLVNNKDRTDQFIFDLLNHEESAFEFSKIVAFCDDIAFAKKRLLSRSARYTGLLNKLDFIEAEIAGGIPTVAQLDGVKSWVAVLEASSEADVLDKCLSIAGVAKSAPSLENIAILLTGAVQLDATRCQQVVGSLNDDNLSYTVVAVGSLEEHEEGKVPYKYTEFGSADGVLASDATFSREESLRMVTELFQLECGVNRALSFTEVYNSNITEARLIKGLREAGYVRMQEVDHMIRVGPEAYQEHVDNWKKENPDAAKGYTTDAWWETEQFQKSVKARSKREEKEIQLVKDARTEEVEKIATEWAKREYFRQSMSSGIGATQLSEEEFIKSVWDRAMFEGDLKYRQISGESTNAEAELADFKAKQERKKQMMLKRAKEELAEALNEENLGGDDLNDVLGDEDEQK